MGATVIGNTGESTALIEFASHRARRLNYPGTDPAPACAVVRELLSPGIWLARRLIPGEALAACRARAEAGGRAPTRAGQYGTAAIIAVWLVLAALTAWLTIRLI